MHNIEYLTEKDLKYFEKKEALGEAVIIRIEPETLLSLDLDELFRDKNKDQTLTAEELDEFLHGGHNHPADTSEMPDAVNQDIPITRIEKNLQQISLPPDQRQGLLQLITSGISDEELMEILQETNE